MAKAAKAAKTAPEAAPAPQPAPAPAEENKPAVTVDMALEQKAAADVIKANKAKDGADGYRMQYEALQEILSGI